MTKEEKKKVFNKVIFAWFKKHHRAMPWREMSDPYRILISEIMLQQTQVDRVRTKYVEFLKLFPDVFTLALAPRDQVLRAWSGLGYNRRAKYLHECAREVVDKYGGVFPSTYDELVALPGIGMSTGGALLAFAFGQETPMIDTNVRRILTRVFFKNTTKQPSDKELYCFAQTIIPKGKGRDWNYALLDIGALVCGARRHSEICPLTPLHGSVGDFVYKKPQKKFAGSSRFYRGRIIRKLIEDHRVSLSDFVLELKLSEKELRPILDGLIKDGMITSSRQHFILKMK